MLWYWAKQSSSLAKHFSQSGFYSLLESWIQISCLRESLQAECFTYRLFLSFFPQVFCVLWSPDKLVLWERGEAVLSQTLLREVWRVVPWLLAAYDRTCYGKKSHVNLSEFHCSVFVFLESFRKKQRVKKLTISRKIIRRECQKVLLTCARTT